MKKTDENGKYLVLSVFFFLFAEMMRKTEEMKGRLRLNEKVIYIGKSVEIYVRKGDGLLPDLPHPERNYTIFFY